MQDRAGNDGQDEQDVMLAATRFAELTGVSRERLRTWERRHGFPRPGRVAAGPRRYRLQDVPRVVAVRRAAEAGVPLREAIARSELAPAEAVVSPAAVGAIAANAPVAVAALSGPEPLRVVFVNRTLAMLPGAPRAGEHLLEARPDFAGTRCVRALHELFSGATEEIEVEHPSWAREGAAPMRSVAFRLPSRPGEHPLVGLLAVSGEGELDARSRLASADREVTGLRALSARQVRWLDALGELALVFQTEPGPDTLGTALDALVRRLGATDAALGSYNAGRIVLPRSRRGSLGPGDLLLAGHPALALAMRDRHATWVAPETARGLGAGGESHVAAVPVVVGGDPLALLLLAFDAEEAITPDVQRLLAAVSAGVGFALLRDRLADELRAAAAR